MCSLRPFAHSAATVAGFVGRTSVTIRSWKLARLELSLFVRPVGSPGVRVLEQIGVDSRGYGQIPHPTASDTRVGQAVGEEA